MKQKIVIAGGTGFIGRYLTAKFTAAGFEVLIISRSGQAMTGRKMFRTLQWKNPGACIAALEGAAVLINLAGKSVNCRYTEKNKKLILNSRVNSTRQLQEWINQCKTPPALWLNAGTATIYRNAQDRPMDEQTGETGSGFSVSVARAWEQAFFEKNNPATRKVALRIPIVLGKEDGALPAYVNLVKYGLGGPQGDGRQMFSWVHIEDIYEIIRFIMHNPQIDGAVNCCSPYPVTNKVFMASLRAIMKPAIYIRSPKWLLQLGAMITGTETELILKSRWVVPGRLMQYGFQFKYPDIDAALNDILNRQRR